MGRLYDLLARDHARLDALLADAAREESYREFRRGLLRHIGIEERILFPLIRKAGRDLRLIEQLHRDHAALSALLVPPPAPAEIDAVRRILEQHNPLEEDAGGLYDEIETLAGDEIEDLLRRVESFPETRVAPHADSELLRRTIAQLLREADEGRKRMRENR